MIGSPVVLLVRFGGASSAEVYLIHLFFGIVGSPSSRRSATPSSPRANGEACLAPARLERDDADMAEQERINRNVNELSQKLLEGCKLLSDSCPETNVPLVSTKDGRMYSVGNGAYYIRDSGGELRKVGAEQPAAEPSPLRSAAGAGSPGPACGGSPWSSAPALPSPSPAAEAEAQSLSARVAQKLLEGYTLLSESCPHTNVPLVQSTAGQIFSVGTGKSYHRVGSELLELSHPPHDGAPASMAIAAAAGMAPPPPPVSMAPPPSMTALPSPRSSAQPPPGSFGFPGSFPGSYPGSYPGSFATAAPAAAPPPQPPQPPPQQPQQPPQRVFGAGSPNEGGPGSPAQKGGHHGTYSRGAAEAAATPPLSRPDFGAAAAGPAHHPVVASTLVVLYQKLEQAHVT